MIWHGFVGLLIAASVAGQELAWRLDGQGGLLQRGFELKRLGDANGDGWEDLVEWGIVPGLPTPHNVIFITSSQDGSILSASPPLPVLYGFKPLSLAAIGDMDQDGVPDYSVTVYDSSGPILPMWVEVRSGATHGVLWSTTIPNASTHLFGGAIAGDMDLDGDDRPDLVVSATRYSPNGTLFVYDNAGNERLRIVDPLPDILVGVGLAPLDGDLDGDGNEDFLSAGPDLTYRGAVVVFSGKDGSVLRVSYGEQPGDKLSFATGCGDLDADGVPDYAGGGGFFSASAVTAFSGATGAPIHTWRVPTSLYMGINLCSGFDLDQDGVNDIVCGQDQRAVHALSGRDGTFLWSHVRPNRGIGIGQTLLAPPPGDPYPLVVYSEREWVDPIWNPAGSNGIAPGRLWAFHGHPNGVRAVGSADSSAGTPLPRSGVRDLPGLPVRWTLSNAEPNQVALLFLGVSNTSFGPLSLPAPLDAFGMPGITLLSSGDIVVPTMTGVGGIANGYAELNLSLAVSQTLSLTGTTLWSQWLWLDPFDLTRGGSAAAQRFIVQ